MKRLFTGVLTLALALAVVACGSDSKDKSLSKADFIKQADAICKKGDAKTNAEAAKVFGGGKKPTEAEQNDFIKNKILPDISNQADEIDGLGKPKGDEDQIKAIVDSVHSAVDKLKSDPASLQSGNNPLDEGTKLANAYGLKVCGKG